MRVLLTGASRGIGRAVAQALLAVNARLALAVREPQSVAALLAGTEGSFALDADLLNPAQTQGLVERAIDGLGGLDALVNCAAVVHYTPIEATTRDQLLEQFEVNFVAPFVLAQRAALHMRAAGGGAIVNVASTLGLTPARDTAAYAASKAALISLTKSLALEFAADRVRVNAVAPGVIDTEMIRAARGPDSTVAATSVETRLSKLRDLHLLRRLGTPDEVADAVLYLVQAEFVTGTVLVVDGGLLLAD